MSDLGLGYFEKYESAVRSYCRTYSVVFTRAKDSFVFDEQGHRYIDFFCGAGAINYGHNNDFVKQAMIDYISDDGILMSLDFHTKSKREFIKSFQENILLPRGLDYKMQFTSPTGTSVVESAVKLARKYTGRENVVAFTGAFHGMSGVSLSLTSNQSHRQKNAYGQVTRLPYEGYEFSGGNTIEYYRSLFENPSSGVDLPAAIVLEAVQGEGGINVCSNKWLQDLSQLAKELGILLIVDDVQAGCGRTGKFFSFEWAGVQPDIVCMSKSIGAIGLPFAVLLFSPELDVWGTGEDNGTFRGNNLAFVAGKTMLENYWKGSDFEKQIAERSSLIENFCYSIKDRYPSYVSAVRGRGLMMGIEFKSDIYTSDIMAKSFKNGIIIESCGRDGIVLKIMPALTIELDVLKEGLGVLDKVIREYCSEDGCSNIESEMDVLENV